MSFLEKINVQSYLKYLGGTGARPAESMLPYLKGMDFPNAQVLANPLLHVRLYNGNLCNLNCRYCYTDAPYTGNGDTFRSVANEDDYYTTRLSTKLETLQVLRDEFGTKTIMMNGKGEPTIEPDFEELLSGINDLGMTPVVVTNGATLMSRGGKFWETLYNNNASIMMKMNSHHNKKLESWLFGLGEQSARYKNIRRITETSEGRAWVQKFAADRRIAMNCVLSVHTMNSDGAESVLRHCRENGVIPWFSWLINSGRAEDADMAVPDNARAGLIKRIEKIDSEYGYKYKLTEDMNLGCTPAMNKNFFQVTAHGRIFLTTRLGQTDDCSKRITNNCNNCNRINGCLADDNIRRKLREHNIRISH
ncbi:MAG: radical SAM protein [Alphaproteobacteria bacterium]|nr:radical SAM protein [Alphaproteobacteria bacterium]